MALPLTREQLKDYCLRELGSPVIMVNVSNDQLEDRIDESLELFQQYHFDGVEKIYLKHKVTASVITFTAPTAAYHLREYLIGQTSGAKASFVDKTGSTARFVYYPGSVAFQPGETVIGEQTALSNVVHPTTPIVLGDLDKKYLTITEPIVSVVNILDISQSTASMFDVRYQFYMNNMPNFSSMDIISYDMFNKQLSLLNFEFNGIKPIRFNKKQDRIYIDFDWTTDPTLDRYIVLECWRALNPTDWPKVWSDYWLRKYTTALIKKQWGSNLIKYTGIELPGKVALNGQTIYDQAVEELRVLDERLQSEFQLPTDFLVG